MQKIPGWAMAALVLAVVLGVSLAGAGPGWAVMAGAGVFLAGLVLRGRSGNGAGDAAAAEDASGGTRDGGRGGE